MIYIGIDPGKSGGIAIITNEFAEAVKMPETERDLYEKILSTTMFLEDNKSIFCILEKVHSMPGQGVVSVCTFCGNNASIRMALIASKIPFETVTPHTWQKYLGIVKRGKDESKTKFKNRLKAKAQELFPELKITLAIADALLIAEYCRRIRNDI